MTGYFRYYCITAVLLCGKAAAYRNWVTTDELENHINPDDLREFLKMYNSSSTSTAQPDPVYISAEAEAAAQPVVPDAVDCFGLGSLANRLPWLFNMHPDPSDAVNTHFFFYSRLQPNRTQVLLGEQFGLEWVDFKATRRTILVIHGFMSHSNASWVNNMARAFLDWGDVNVITVDWSGGGNTWKYWRAVANTRRVGADVVQFMTRLTAETGARVKDFHFVGHSLGAHICSFVSYHLGGVARITGLDPAQPCFRTSNHSERLDKSDADFVDIIHTNGRLLKKIGFGLPEPAGHADFYPNGGMKQPGCHNRTNSLWSRFWPFSPNRLQQAICSHGRAYLLFTESLVNKNCSFMAYRWDLTYEGVNGSLRTTCDRSASGSCCEMGIRSIGGRGFPRARGLYFVLTAEKVPYCPTETERQSPVQHLLKDLREGFQLGRPAASPTTRLPDYADPEARRDAAATTKASWFSWCAWAGVLLASAGALALLLAPAARRGAALSYTPDTRHLHWLTPFPAVTVCEAFVPTATQRKFTQLHSELMEPLNYNYRRYLTNLLYGLGVCTKEVCVPCGLTVACDLPWRSILENIHKSCEELIAGCRFNGEDFPCCDRFRAADAEHGPCYSFNSLLTKDSMPDSLFVVNRSTGPGLLSFHLLADAHISVHSREELSTNNLDNKFKFQVKVRDASWLEYLFAILEMENDPSLKFEDIDVRGCRYHEEVPETPLYVYPVYSYGACKLAQSTESSFAKCGCIHPARDIAYRDTYCNYTGLNCLVAFEANQYKLGVDEQATRAPCVPSCTESELTTIHISKKKIRTDTDGEGTAVNIRMASLPSLRYERNLLRTNLDLVVSIGGTVGLFFGASLLSLVEIFYLIFRSRD